MKKEDEVSPPQEPAQQPSLELPKAEAWSISFTKPKRKVTKKEKKAMMLSQGVAPANSDSDAACEPTEGQQKSPEGVVVDPDDFIDEAVAIPRQLTSTKEDLIQRNYFNNDRWLCMARQYKASCGVSSLTSVWNYLYSRLGAGTLAPVSQEEIMSILGFRPPFERIRWGPFTGNVTLMRWFHEINRHFGVSGKAYYLYKAHGTGRTIGLTSDAARDLVKQSLKNPAMGVVYHCHNHYMVPIGYQDLPLAQVDNYAATVPESAVTTSIIIGEVSRGRHTCFHVKKWDEISTDINCESPYFMNIRQSEKGVQCREKGTKNPGGNLHCLIMFRSDVAEENLAQFTEGLDEEGVEENDVEDVADDGIKDDE